MPTDKPLTVSQKIAQRITVYYETTYGIYEADGVSKRKIRRLIDAEIRPLVEALDGIRRLGGNLPDDRLTSRTGSNDAAHRGLMYCSARQMANTALEKIKAP